MKHIAYIMDGNRSWAKEAGLPAFEGHRAGYENAKKILRESQSRGIPYVSFWALSDDNIYKRDTTELKALFKLLEYGILDLAKEADENNIRIICIGDRTLLPEKCRKSMEKAERMTKENTSTVAIIAIGYGGQEEIVRAVRRLATSGFDFSELTKEVLLENLESGAFPPPDLIIRTGGHMRHSGFLLFLSPYAEYFFSSKNWPAFGPSDLDEALEQYNRDERKFGK